MLVQSYLFFNGRCEEAIAFYQKTLGAQVTMMMRFKENPEPMTEGCGPGGGAIPGENIMHASFKIGETEVMASDGMESGKPEFKGFSLSLTAASDAEAQRLFKALGDGGKVEMPMDKTFFASSFGMVVDRFGVSWMVIKPLPMP
ncbi:VOC family protein [Polaromonas sp. JS666]|uniref:VOC family protein n=1 Tax=Polaromonas sp. (strain JS666 / ATCC BAA-500) TaxID=296591 RepID=UPI000889147B|nr:VOC family protein [Polaromonas sp. JS666]SDO24703.1 PhnB protein [Polaromonas sp. JS666]